MNCIDLSWKNILTKDILHILKNHSNKNNITSLNLEGNRLEIRGLYILFKYISKYFKNIVHLNLSNTNLSRSEYFILSKELKKLKELKSLFLDCNVFLGKSVYYFIPIFHQLKYLSLNSCPISYQGIKYLCNEFSKMENLQSLSLLNCDLSSKELFILSENISKLKNLKFLYLKGNYCNLSILSYLLLEIPKDNLILLDLGDLCNFELNDGIYQYKLNYTSFLSSQLELFKNLEILTWNMYYDTHIMNGIEKLKKIKKLILNYSYFDYNISISFFPFLKNLEYIKLSYLDNKSLEIILENLPKSIKYLYINNIFLDYSIIFSLSKNLIFYKNLVGFYLNHTNIHYIYIYELCNSLINLKNLKYLSFHSCNLNNSCFNKIIKILPYLVNLKSLYLQENNISYNEIDNLIHSLCFRKEKISIYLNNNSNILNNSFLSLEKSNFFKKEMEEILNFNKKLDYYWINEIKENYIKIKKYKPFYHFIDIFFIYKNYNNINQYNESLKKVQDRMNEKKYYFLFSMQMEKTYSNNSFFYNRDIQRYIYTFL